MLISRRTLAGLLALAPLGPALAKPAGPSAPVRAGLSDSAAFAADLHGRLAPGQDLIASPYSLRAAMLLAYAGAAGATAAQMRAVLRLPAWEAFAASTAPAPDAPPAPDDRRPRLEVANAIWPASDILLRPAYVALLRRAMGVGVQGLDFSRPAAADTISPTRPSYRVSIRLMKRRATSRRLGVSTGMSSMNTVWKAWAMLR